jgi:alpha-galactosidase
MFLQDMLETGVMNTGGSFPPLSFVEARTNFGAWAIVSSPLIIGLNVTDGPTMDFAWDILSNTEVIAVNQNYSGFSGTIFKSSNVSISFSPCTWVQDECSFPTWHYLYKPLPNGATAVLLMNNALDTTSLTVQWGDVPGLTAGATYNVRDLYAHADLGQFAGQYTAVGLTPHDSAMLLLTPA